MPQENLEVARQIIEMNRSGNLDDAGIEAFLALGHPNCEWTSLMAAVEPQTYHGHEALRRYIGELAATWQEWRSEVEEVVEVDTDTVIVTARFYGVGKSSAAPVETPFAALLVLSGAKLVRGCAYPSREEALEAAGLRD